MMLRSLIVGAGIAALTLAGCDEQNGAKSNEAEAQERTTAGDVARDASDAAATAGEFAKDQIDSYKQHARVGLEAIEASIDDIAQRVETMSDEARSEAQQTLDGLRAQRDAFIAALAEASADSAEAWNDVKAGLDRAWEELATATESAMDRFGSESESPEPSETGSGDNESGDG